MSEPWRERQYHYLLLLEESTARIKARWQNAPQEEFLAEWLILSEDVANAIKDSRP